jgi:hypothetical protein
MATLQGIDAFFAKPVGPDQIVAAVIRNLSGGGGWLFLLW